MKMEDNTITCEECGIDVEDDTTYPLDSKNVCYNCYYEDSRELGGG